MSAASLADMHRPDASLDAVLAAAGLPSPGCLVAADDAIRARIASYRRKGHPVPRELHEAAERLDAALLEAKFDNVPV
jgi:hypothetical protein